MQIVIEIDEELYKHTHEVMGVYPCSESYEIYKAIRNGIVLPEGHGRLIDGDLLLNEMENGIKSGLGFEGYEEYPHINDMDDCVECVMYSDTIIPEDKETENDK